MKAAAVPLEIEVGAEIRSDAVLAEAVRAASEYFQSDYLDLPEEEEVVGAKLKWGRIGSSELVARFEECYQDLRKTTANKRSQIRHILDLKGREMEMHALLRLVIQLRWKIVMDRRSRLMEQLYTEEEELEHAS